MILLSILICGLEERKEQYDRLYKSLKKQLVDGVEIDFFVDSRENSIGHKRNMLLQSAKGKYVCFIDDDDRISANYVSLILEGLKKDVDCCSLTGEITFNGENPKKFIHSIEYHDYFEENEVYFRPPNHLNAIRKSIAEQFHFPEVNHGEDTNWAMHISNSNMLKSEHKITDTIYFYDYLTDK